MVAMYFDFCAVYIILSNRHPPISYLQQVMGPGTLGRRRMAEAKQVSVCALRPDQIIDLLFHGSGGSVIHRMQL